MSRRKRKIERPSAGRLRPAAGLPSSGGGSGGAKAVFVTSWGRGWRTVLVAVGPILLMTATACMVAIGRGFPARKPGGQLDGPVAAQGTIPGEFERQAAILLAWPLEGRQPLPGQANELSVREDRLLCDVTRAIHGSIRVLILVQDSRSEERVRRLLSQAEVPAHAVSFVHVPFESEWIRDYGPMGVRASDGSCTWIDGDYGAFLAGIDPHGDRLPSVLGPLLEMPVVRAPISVDHGNLLSNGRGLCITTQRLIDENAARGYGLEDVTRVLQRFYGVREVVFLEALQGEPTGHVDMFATFPSPDVVVAARCSPEADPVNAAILDRNAERLASVRGPCGPVRVVRIPMPRLRSRPKVWPTYTNVVYANDKLLVPVYPGLDPAAESAALALYRELLPGWTILGIDGVALIEVHGSLHCVTLNVPSIKGIHRDPGENRPDAGVPAY
jgi:agmatine/peptidylarginine deiminase